MTRLVLNSLCATTVLCSVYTHAGISIDELSEAVQSGKVALNFRYRLEHVDQDGIDNEANASTLRSRLTYTSGKIKDHWSFGIEADSVAVIGDERYNSTENGLAEFPVVADPEGFDLNQSFIKYEKDSFSVTTGTQRILHGNQRFVGGVGWRQNEQTYDAVRVTFKPADNVSIDYSYVWNVHRIFGPEAGAQPSDWDSDSHFLVATITPAKGHKVEGFAYLLDFDNDNGIPNSTATYGINYAGEFGPVKLNATYASQSEDGDSPLDYDADYMAAEISTKIEKVTLKAGIETLGSDDGDAAFRTPLATLHKFQGWADKFLLTPADGIEDTYVAVAAPLGPVKVSLIYHDYQADDGDRDFGDEINFVANYALNKRVKFQLKAADFSAEDLATDTSKYWLSTIISL